jgi:hypothetical protein
LIPTTNTARACAFVLAASCAISAAAADQAGKKPKPKPKPRPAPVQKTAPALPPEKAPVPQQWKAASRYVVGGQESIITLYASGPRQRVELGSGNGGSGASLGADPTLNALTTLLGSNETAGDESTPESAVAAALHRGATDIIKDWQKK